jgi:ribosomal protein S14
MVIGAVPLTSSASKDRPTAVTTHVSARRCEPSGSKLGVLTDSRWMARRCLRG